MNRHFRFPTRHPDSKSIVAARNPPPVGRKIELHLWTQEWKGQIYVEAIVRRVVPDTGMGVEFVVLSNDANRQLRELVRSVASAEEPVRFSGRS